MSTKKIPGPRAGDPFKEVTVLEVQIRNDKKVWVITRNDADKSLVGEITASGTPARAKDLPVGFVFTSTLQPGGAFQKGIFPTSEDSLKEILQQIHDEADHIHGQADLTTGSLYEVASKDSREIKRLAKKALKLLEKK